jgi:transcriptional regulator with XRE-family HTH domain
MDSDYIRTIHADWKEAVARTVVFERWRCGLSQLSLARRMGAYRTNVCRTENAKLCRMPTLESIERLARALNVAPWDFVLTIEARALLISIRRTRRAERLQKAS